MSTPRIVSRAILANVPVLVSTMMTKGLSIRSSSAVLRMPVMYGLCFVCASGIVFLGAFVAIMGFLFPLRSRTSRKV
jgi:hypothetical protein